MALLDRSLTRSLTIAACVLAAVAGSCMLFVAGGNGRPVFSHRLHVGDEALECINCHADAAVLDSPGMPDPDTCALCHEDLDAGKPPERSVDALFAEQTFRAQHNGALGDEVRFSHSRHVELEGGCESCHAGLIQADAPDPAFAVRMDACVRCHEQRQAASDCAACHLEIDTLWKPPSHLLGWVRAHGAAVRSPHHAEQGSRCSLCHEDSSCAACHRVELPVSHNQFWRLRGHGVAAMIDRTSCSTCHIATDCNACHSEMMPASHTASFSGTRSNHCLACHEPLSRTSCSVCHAATPSHSLAPPKPEWHTPTMNCRECHGASIRLPHADNGGNCNACHG